MTALYTGGDGTPLVLLHGATASWRAWRPVLPLLEPHHALYAPTMAGHLGGEPLDVAPEKVVDAMVDAMERQLDRDGIGQAHLVGNSLGGWVALELARRGRALSTVALSPAGAWELPRDLDKLLRLFRIGAALGTRPTVRRLASVPWIRRIILRNVCEHGERMPPAEVTGMFEDMAGCAVLLPLLDGARDAGPIAAFEQIDSPVRIAWAGKDRTLPFPRYGRPMLRAVPQAELVTMPGVGHVPMYDDPALVARTILDVTSRVDLESGSPRRLRLSRRPSTSKENP